MEKRIKVLLAVVSAALALCLIAALRAWEAAITEAPTGLEEIDLPADSATELWSDDGSLRQVKSLDIPLDAEAQWAIYDACECDAFLFCFIMAIAEHESKFDPQTAGDGGNSLGIMQINTRWHTDRMEVLGVTDLTDPVQCAAVAIDYLQELEILYGFEPESNAILMAYNMGPSAAKAAIKNGTHSTEYSQEVMSVYQGYLAELEGAN